MEEFDINVKKISILNFFVKWYEIKQNSQLDHSDHKIVRSDVMVDLKSDLITITTQPIESNIFNIDAFPFG